MASTVTTGTGSLVYERRVARVHKYHWPALQLNVWMLIMLIASSTIIGVFASFIVIQQTLGLYNPWYVLDPSTMFRYSGCRGWRGIGRTHRHPPTVLCRGAHARRRGDGGDESREERRN